MPLGETASTDASMATLDHSLQTVDSTTSVRRDHRRWVILIIASATATIAALDSTILNVAIPTIMRDFDATLPSVQWVIAGYSLVFASLLVTGGRLGDIFGHRRIFIVGASLFGIGSLVAALSQSVVQLVVGEAMIEGMGAALMMPAAIAILSKSFDGHERAMAFAIWGAFAGAGAVFGPVVGGLLTSYASWRWGFLINVIVVPIVIAAAVLFIPRLQRSGHRQRLDISGALLLATGMALLLFTVSEGERYGWLRPKRAFTLRGLDVWPQSNPISVVVIACAASIVLLGAFYRVSRHKERNDADPLFEFEQFRKRAFRVGMIVTLVMGVGQVTIMFVLPVFLQEGRGLSASQVGLWLLPVGAIYMASTFLGGRLARRVALRTLIRIGLLLWACAYFYLASVISPGLTFLTVVPMYLLFPLGAGFVIPQLANVVLADVEPAKVGAGGGAHTTARQMGISLGAATTSVLLSAKTITAGVTKVNDAGALPAALKARAVSALRADGVTFEPPSGATAAQASALRRIFNESLVSGSQWAFLFAAITLLLALGLSMFIPRGRDPHRSGRERDPNATTARTAH